VSTNPRVPWTIASGRSLWEEAEFFEPKREGQGIGAQRQGLVNSGLGLTEPIRNSLPTYTQGRGGRTGIPVRPEVGAKRLFETSPFITF
jgi:hypothetical protein